VSETLENPSPDGKQSPAQPVDGKLATVALPTMRGKSFSG